MKLLFTHYSGIVINFSDLNNWFLEKIKSYQPDRISIIVAANYDMDHCNDIILADDHYISTDINQLLEGKHSSGNVDIFVINDVVNHAITIGHIPLTNVVIKWPFEESNERK